VITAKAFAGKHYAVYGLARSGIATVEALLASGARVTAWDGKPAAVENFPTSRAKSRGAATTSEVRPSTTLGTNEFSSPQTRQRRRVAFRVRSFFGVVGARLLDRFGLCAVDKA